MNGFERYLTGRDLSGNTIKWYNMYALDFIAWLDTQNTDADNATAGDITAWLNHLKQKGQANITRRNNLIAIRHFFDYRVRQGARQDNPARHIKLRGIKHKILYPIMSIAELESIYHHYTTPDETTTDKWLAGHPEIYKTSRLSRQRNKVMLGLMVWQGLTTAEVNDLTLQDLKLKEGTIYIAGGRKSNERTLELKPQQIMELMEYLMQTRRELLKCCNNETDNRLFLPSPAAGKKTITDNNAINVWKRLGQEVRTQHPRFINFLQVRTSVITHWLKQYNLRQVQYMAGHRYVSSTEAYQMGNMEELQEDINKYHPIG
jgi:site-specific recombinase XerD